jgi:riboflavin biosynthesis pyrimidine reductase
MIVTEVVPRSHEQADADTDEGREWLRARYSRPDESYVRLNMITSLTGSASGADGTSETLTNRVDRRILGVIRAAADVVVVGAQSVRAEGYIVPRSARLAIVTASGDLQGHRLSLAPGAEPDRVLIVCPESRAAELEPRAAEHGVQLVPVRGGDRLDPRAIVEALSRRGLSRIVCEGGPSLASQFAASGLIDEYCVTVAPVLEPANQSFVRLDGAQRPRTEVAGMLVDDDGFSYLRLRAT